MPALTLLRKNRRFMRKGRPYSRPFFRAIFPSETAERLSSLPSVSTTPKKSSTPRTGLNLLLRSSTCCLRTTSCSFFCCFSRRSSARSSSTLVILFIVFFSLKKVPDKDVGQRAFDIIPFDHPDHRSDASRVGKECVRTV